MANYLKNMNEAPDGYYTSSTSSPTYTHGAGQWHQTTSSTTNPSPINFRSFDPSDSSNPDHLLPVNDEKPDMVWNIAKLTITGRFEDDMRLNDYLRIGWEPFNVAHVGYNLCIVYLRRLETI